MKHTQIWLFLMALLILACLFFFNGSFLASSYDFANYSDHPTILQGYNQTPNLLRDGLKWWRGNWINQGPQGYRPLSSYVYWVQVWLGLNYGWVWPSWISFALLYFSILVITGIAGRLSRSYFVALLAGLASCAVTFWLPSYELDFLQAYLFSDNYLCLLFNLLCLWFFIGWKYDGASWQIIGAWVALVLACFSKEASYILPAQTAVLSFLPAKITWRNSLRQAALMMPVVLGFYFYRAMVLEAPRNPGNGHMVLKTILDSWTPSIESWLEVWWLLLPIKAILIWVLRKPLLASWHDQEARRLWIASLLLWACVQLAYIPVMGLNTTSHNGHMIVAMKCLSFCIAASALLRALQENKFSTNCGRFPRCLSKPIWIASSSNKESSLGRWNPREIEP